jgi:hypothetical protein
MTREYPVVCGTKPRLLREYVSSPAGREDVFVDRAIYDLSKSHDVVVTIKPRWDVQKEKPYWEIDVSNAVGGIGPVSEIETSFESVKQAAAYIEQSVETLQSD